MIIHTSQTKGNFKIRKKTAVKFNTYIYKLHRSKLLSKFKRTLWNCIKLDFADNCGNDNGIEKKSIGNSEKNVSI